MVDKSFSSEKTYGTEVIRSNLSELGSRFEILLRMRKAQIFELWNLIESCENNADTDRMITIISETFEKVMDDIKSDIPEYPNTLEKCLLSHDKAILCRLAAEKLRNNTEFTFEDIFGYFEEPQDSARGKIACIRRNEEAFDILSKAVKNPKILYTDSYADACDAVHNGNAEFCILPIMNTSEGRLKSFQSLILRYELKIFAVFDNKTSDETSKSTRYALLRRRISADSEFDEFDIMLDISSQSQISDVANVAQFLGMSVLSAELCYGKVYILSFSAKSDNFLPFLIFLAAFYPGFVPLGIFKVIA